MWAAAPDHVRQVSGHINVAFLERVIKEAGYVDVALPSQILSGFDLIGPTPVSGAFPRYSEEDWSLELDEEEAIAKRTAQEDGNETPHFRGND